MLLARWRDAGRRFGNSRHKLFLCRDVGARLPNIRKASIYKASCLHHEPVKLYKAIWFCTRSGFSMLYHVWSYNPRPVKRISYRVIAKQLCRGTESSTSRSAPDLTIRPIDNDQLMVKDIEGVRIESPLIQETTRLRLQLMSPVPSEMRLPARTQKPTRFWVHSVMNRQRVEMRVIFATLLRSPGH